MNARRLQRIVLTALAVSMPIAAETSAIDSVPGFGNSAFAVVFTRAHPPNWVVSPSGRADWRCSANHAQSDLYPYDGAWEGELRTTFSSAPCGMRYRLKMLVTEGAATGSAARGGERFTLYGNISADGKLSWTVTGGRGGAAGEGLVDGGAARGGWEDDTGQCSGTFSIEKIH